jgi:signal transduction histidine kinase
VRLQTRITVTAVTIITAVSLSVGYGAISSSYQSDLNRLDSTLEISATQISNATDGQELSTALLIGSSFGDDLSIYFYDINKNVSSLQDGRLDLGLGLTHSRMLSAIDKPVSVGASSAGTLSYRLRSVALADNELILLATPTDQVDQARNQNIAVLLWYVAIADLISAFGLALLVRRDLKGIRSLIRQTKDVSENRAVEIEATDSVSEVTELSVALHQMVDRLKAAQISMQQFLGDASHELRTPLTTIRGYLDILSKSVDAANPELTKKAVGIMTAEAGRMQQLIDDLLLLAQLGEGASSKNLTEKVDFDKVIQAQFEHLVDLQPTRSVRLNVLPTQVLGSTELLTRLVANLVSNIRRHTPSVASVNVNLEADHGGMVLTVEDAGPGLNPQAYDVAPSNFQRFDQARSREHGGAGLGMSIMSQIVGVHGGNMQLSRSSMGGLKTIIWLPLIGPKNPTKPLLIDSK